MTDQNKDQQTTDTHQCSHAEFIIDAATAPELLTEEGKKLLNSAPVQAIQITDASVTTGANEEEILSADASYERLRKAVGDAITAAIKSGKVLLQLKKNGIDNTGPLGAAVIAFPVWHGALPHSTQQHYNCRHCQAVWEELFTISILEDDGKRVYPAVQALLSIKDDPVVANILANAPEGFEKYLEDFVSLPGQVTLPIANFPLNLSDEDVGGWSHFYAAPKEVLQEYNDKHAAFLDFYYIDQMLGEFTHKKLNVASLTLLFTYLKNELLVESKKTALTGSSALDRSDELVKIIAQTRFHEANGRLGAPYLWSILQRKENSWLQHVQKSMLGIVLKGFTELQDSSDVEASVASIKKILVRASKLDTFKVKTGEVAAATVEQAYNFLVENNMKSTLIRRIMDTDEVESRIWGEAVPEAATTQEPSGTPQDLDAVFKRLQESKDKAVNTENQLSALVGNQVFHEKMSLEAFIATLGDVSTMQLVLQPNAGYIPIFITTAVEDGDHDDLLKFDTICGKYASLLASQNAVPVREILQYANFDQVSTANAKLTVTAVIKRLTNNHDTDQGYSYVLNIPHVAENFSKTVAAYGSCVLGTMIRSEYYGLSGAITEMSRQFAMQPNPSGAGKAAGGLQFTAGMQVEVVYKDGKHGFVTITSSK